MLTNKAYEQWCDRLALKASARAFVTRVRTSEPARRVQSSAGNVSGRYPSRKMGRTIQFESHKVELAGIYEKEHDPDVLEYYDQPCTIRLEYPSPTGRTATADHTPDYFVIRVDSAGFEEWKAESQLEILAEKMPNRYVKGPDGKWSCPPGEEYAAKYGLYYQVRTDKEIDWTLQRNLHFLEQYFRHEYTVEDPEQENDLVAFVTQTPGVSLADLLARYRSIQSDLIYALIVADKLYVDLTEAPLAEPDRCRVYATEAAAAADNALIASRLREQMPLLPAPVRLEAGSKVKWDGRTWTIVNVGVSKITLLDEGDTTVPLPLSVMEDLVKAGSIQGVPFDESEASKAKFAHERLLEASPAEVEEANHRYRVIAPILQGQTPRETPVSSRSLRRWIAKYRTAQQLYGYGFLGLLPRHHEKGNRSAKIHPDAQQVIQEIIASQFETVDQKQIPAVYGALQAACEEKGFDAPSMKSFRAALKRRDQLKQTEKREGPRKAYSREVQYMELTMTTPRHGDRPFEICHIDHTELDIECVYSRTGKPLGRPWATFLVDAYSRRLLAVWLTFDPPSYRSCMMVLRICVQRHGRLPQTIVIDGGKEFSSIYFEALAAMYEATIKTRPPAKARFGSVIERLFGTANTQFVHNLTGNTQVMRNVRQVTKSVNPKTHATWDLPSLYERLCQWAYEVYDTNEHPALAQTPREAFESALSRTGHRPQCLISYNETFQMMTLPSTKQGTAKVQPGRGVKIGYLYYSPASSTVFRDPTVESQQVPVRYDPFNIGVAYAYAKGTWVRCLSDYYKDFEGRTEREVKMATAELRKARQRHAAGYSLTAKKIADFLKTAEAQQALVQQQRRDAEMREILKVIDGGKAAVRTESATVVRLDDRRTTAAEVKKPSAKSLIPANLQPYGELD